MSDLNKIIKPIFLLADSQLLFYSNHDGLFLDRIKKLLNRDIRDFGVKAAYIGASNNDNPHFFEVFRTAFQQIDIHNCRMIKSAPDADDTIFLKNSDIILLSGGDTEKGWNTIRQNGWDSIIVERYSNGAILIGISAGAIQLGIREFNEYPDEKKNMCFDSLRLVPFIIDVHADDLWQRLVEYLISEGNGAKGMGIPKGAGLVYYPDESIEAVRFECIEFHNINSRIKRSAIKSS
ncbi:MAG: Type 1 glutamine amidotransferase-like domain-containing protein [Bacteroidales bacterium]|nr:Type 1 glutamine amidotransferase-like domain-containing protein [Bacteroidales bacterium]